MGIIATNKNQITFIYNANSTIGKQGLGYAQSTCKDLHVIDTSKTNIPGTQWVEIAKKTHKEVQQLIEKEHPDVVKLVNKDAVLNTEDWLKIIDKNPQVVVCPILIVGETYFQIETPSDITNHIEAENMKTTRNPRSKKD